MKDPHMDYLSTSWTILKKIKVREIKWLIQEEDPTRTSEKKRSEEVSQMVPILKLYSEK